ncbi:MAG: DUF63 family protein [Candidatus Thalassarchaeaceae archaeon]|nr:MAG: hypothetical protein CND84_05360 [Marine Group II euryarchaeote MED-G35]
MAIRRPVNNPLDEAHPYETWAINALLAVFLLIFLGLGLEWAGIENFLSESLNEYFIDPIKGESTGDSGYNVVNTMTYAIVLGLFVVALSAWLRRLGIDPTDTSLLALLPFITWAVFGEVAEDAEMFGAGLAPYFVSPGIHFQAAFWVVLAGAAGISLDRAEREGHSQKNDLETMATGLILIQFVVYASSISGKEGDLSLWPMLLGVIAAIAFALWSRELSGLFSNVQRMVYLTGVGGSLIFFGALASFTIDSPPATDRIWPLVVVIGVPAVVCYWMYSQGRSAVAELSRQGLVAGILPPGMSDDEYRKSSADDLPEKGIIEPLRSRAIMAQPLVFLAVAGQIMDGLATWIGIDGFPGLGEKHVASQRVIDAGLWVNEGLGIEHGMLDEGVWLFALVKFALAGLIYYVFYSLNFERREQHLRLLIGLAMLVVGMAPGLRDVGRLTLGV